jgi:DNA-directed RNA polymerase specialized sigma24 family protein
MVLRDGLSRSGPGGARSFATTHWSIVLAAARGSRPDARAALATLCETYWYPLYAYVRRLGHKADEAQDLTQGFFAALLEKRYVKAADRERGRFRSFLLTALKRFLSKERDRAHARKRGGDAPPISLDLEAGDGRYALEPSHDVTPEAIYERRWALTILDRVIMGLRQNYAGAGKAGLFDRLKEFLTGEPDASPYERVARELGMSEGAVKVAVHRLRRRYRDLLRAEIARTVADPEEVDDELKYLLAVLQGGKC